MAVYSTMIRDDPDSRARMRVTPEQTLNLPVHYCLASWIAGGTRAASFIGETFPFPAAITDAWARVHLERLREKVGPYPEGMASTLERVAPRAADRNADGPSAPPASARRDPRRGHRIRPTGRRHTPGTGRRTASAAAADAPSRRRPASESPSERAVRRATPPGRARDRVPATSSP